MRRVRKVTLFLLEYDRRTEQITALDEYRERDRAHAMLDLRRREAEKEPHVEVVLLEAGSRDELKRTHSRYFQTGRSLARG